MMVKINDKLNSGWAGEIGKVIRVRGTTDDFLNNLVMLKDRPGGVWFSKKEIEKL